MSTQAKRKNTPATKRFVLVGEHFGTKPFPAGDNFFQKLIRQAVKEQI
jgi:hypothetical protein